jgi:hypothetical protein
VKLENTKNMIRLACGLGTCTSDPVLVTVAGIIIIKEVYLLC